MLKRTGGEAARSRAPLLTAYLEDPEGSLQRLATALEVYHEVAISPHWSRLRALLAGDVLRRAQALATVSVWSRTSPSPTTLPVASIETMPDT